LHRTCHGWSFARVSAAAARGVARVRSTSIRERVPYAGIDLALLTRRRLTPLGMFYAGSVAGLLAEQRVAELRSSDITSHAVHMG